MQEIEDTLEIEAAATAEAGEVGLASQEVEDRALEASDLGREAPDKVGIGFLHEEKRADAQE